MSSTYSWGSRISQRQGCQPSRGAWTHKFYKNFSKTAWNLMNLTPTNDIPWGGWEPVFHAGDNCMWVTLCWQLHVSIIKTTSWCDYYLSILFILPVADLNLGMHNMLGRDRLCFTFMWTLYQLPSFDSCISTWLKLPNTWSSNISIIFTNFTHASFSIFNILKS